MNGGFYLKTRNVFYLFLLLNIMNYLDRQITSAVLPLLKESFNATDQMLGILGTAFMITYALTALPFGIWSDRWQPHKVAAIGAVVWSSATILSAFAWSIESLYVFRAFIGVGEAAFVATGSTILSKLYVQSKRARIMGLFNLGMPIGSSIGVLAGGAIGLQFGWQFAFLIVGFPGLILAFFTWRLKLDRNPDHQKLPSNQEGTKINLSDVKQLFLNKPFILLSVGYAMISYGFGALSFFGPTLLQRELGYSIDTAGLVLGAIIALSGFIGVPIGGYIADYWHKYNPRARIHVITISMIISCILLLMGLQWVNIPLIGISIFFLFWHVGVILALLYDVTELRIWNTATALMLFIMHIIGDVPSPTVTGMISDQTNLLFSLKLLVIPMFLAVIFFIWMNRYISSKTVNSPATPPGSDHASL